MNAKSKSDLLLGMNSPESVVRRIKANQEPRKLQSQQQAARKLSA
jgi:hypothetical protein